VVKRGSFIRRKGLGKVAISEHHSRAFQVSFRRCHVEDKIGRLPPMKTNTLALILTSLLTGFAFLQPLPAVVPPPDGGYPGFNTAEDDDEHRRALMRSAI
jgi:hypothetical protein